MTTSTAWGKSQKTTDIRALRRMLRVFRLLATTGEVLAAFATLLLAGVLLWGMININFENVIFYDGSERVCAMTNEEIHNVE